MVAAAAAAAAGRAISRHQEEAEVAQVGAEAHWQQQQTAVEAVRGPEVAADLLDLAVEEVDLRHFAEAALLTLTTAVELEDGVDQDAAME